MYLLDTDVFIWILRGRKDLVNRVSALRNKSPLSLSVITIAEVYQNTFPSELLTTEDSVKAFALAQHTKFVKYFVYKTLNFNCVIAWLPCENIILKF